MRSLSTENQLVSSSPDLFDEEYHKLFYQPPKSDEPGLAVTLILDRGLQMPLSTTSCTSGFDYPAELQRYGILQGDWQRFAQTICLETKVLRKQRITVIGQYPDSLAIGGVIVGILGAVPAFFVSGTARMKQQQRNLIAGLADGQGETLARHLALWNDSIFRPKGVVIRLDLFGGYWNYLEGTEPHAMTPASFTVVGRPGDTTEKTARVVVILLQM